MTPPNHPNKTPEDPKDIIFFVLNSSGKRIGSAFLVEDNIFLTCAHVVGMAVAGRDDANVSIDTEVTLESVGNNKPITAKVLHFIPYNKGTTEPSKQGKEDIALLKTQEQGWLFLHHMPGWQITPPGGEKYSVFGIIKTGSTAVWSYGSVKDKEERGWYQLEGDCGSGISVSRGMSGSPVFNEDKTGIIGMIVTRLKNGEDEQDSGVSFMIPYSIINELLGHLACFHLKLGANTELDSAIIQLNFNDQYDAFENVLNSRSCCGFLIRGKRYYGQELLLQKLLSLIKSDAHIVSLDLEGMYDETNDPFESIYMSFSINNTFKGFSDFLEGYIVPSLRCHPIVITLQLPNRCRKEEVASLINKFWQPLTDCVNSELAKKGGPYEKLILFIVDRYMVSAGWNDLFTMSEETIEADKITKGSIFRLKDIEPFPELILRRWITKHLQEFKDARDQHFDSSVKRIHQRSGNGVPLSILTHIYNIFGRRYSP